MFDKYRNLVCLSIYGPRREKTGLRGFRQSKFQTVSSATETS